MKYLILIIALTLMGCSQSEPKFKIGQMACIGSVRVMIADLWPNGKGGFKYEIAYKTGSNPNVDEVLISECK